MKEREVDERENTGTTNLISSRIMLSRLECARTNMIGLQQTVH